MRGYRSDDSDHTFPVVIYIACITMLRRCTPIMASSSFNPLLWKLWKGILFIIICPIHQSILLISIDWENVSAEYPTTICVSVQYSSAYNTPYVSAQPHHADSPCVSHSTGHTCPTAPQSPSCSGKCVQESGGGGLLWISLALAMAAAYHIMIARHILSSSEVVRCQ